MSDPARWLARIEMALWKRDEGKAPAELWLRPNGRSYYVTELSDEPDAVRYVRADLYEALRARLDGLMEQMTVVRSWNEAPGLEPLDELKKALLLRALTAGWLYPR